jgi:hypothetical protein
LDLKGETRGEDKKEHWIIRDKMDLYSTLLEIARKSHAKILELEATQSQAKDVQETLLSHVKTCLLSTDVVLSKSDSLSVVEQVHLRMTLAGLLLKYTADYEILDEHLLKAVSL